MPRPAPVFEDVQITPTVTVKLKLSVLRSFPEAPAFIRDQVGSGERSTATALEYARRVAAAAARGHLTRPELCTYSTERTAVNAYWRWVGQRYELRIEKVAQAVRARGHGEIRDKADRLTVGCLSPPFMGKQVAIPNHPNVAAQGGPSHTLHDAQGHWTVHVPPHDVEPHNHRSICYTCTPYVLENDELEAIAHAFYDAYGPNRDPFTLPIDAPLFGRVPLKGLFSAPTNPVPPFGAVTALVPPHTLLEGYLDRIHATTTADVATFIQRIESYGVDVAIVDLRQINDEELESVMQALRASRRSNRSGQNPAAVPEGTGFAALPAAQS